MFSWRFGNESVLDRTRQIKNTFVAAICLRPAAVGCHHVRIDVNRVDRIGDRDFVLVPKNIENISAITFRSVRDKDLIIRDLDVAVAIIVLHDCRSKKFVTLLGTVTAKCLTFPQVIGSTLHRVDCRARKRLGYVTNSAANQSLCGFRITFAKLAHASRDLRKQISSLKLEIIFV